MKIKDQIEKKELEIITQIEDDSQIVVRQAVSKADGILDDLSYKEAGDFRVIVNKWRREAKDKLEPMRQKTYSAYKETLKLLDEVIKPFDEAIKIIDVKIIEYKNKQERLAKIEEERLRAIAKKQQEEAQIEMAEQMARAGDHQKAEAVLSQIQITPTIKIETQKIQGMSFRENWSAEVFDLKELIAAIYDGTVPIQAVEPNTAFLNSMARSLKQNLKYPGVNVIKQELASSRVK